MPSPTVRSHLLALTGTAVPPGLLVFASAPWWALLLAGTPGSVALLLGAVMPQESHDRLELLREFLRLFRPAGQAGTASSASPPP